MEQCLVLGARRFSFKDDSGKQVEGVTLNYLTGDVDKEEDRRGCSPLSISGPDAVWRDLVDLPGRYELDFKQRPGKNNRPTLQVVGVNYLGPADLFPVDHGKAG